MIGLSVNVFATSWAGAPLALRTTIATINAGTLLTSPPGSRVSERPRAV
jgi:hypothetical protein